MAAHDGGRRTSPTASSCASSTAPTSPTRSTAILATTRLAPLAERYPAELSGGQQQRVSLARALIVEPDTLLLDEPLSNLDANLREEMRFEVRRLHDAYRYTTIYVTHDQSEAMTTADLIAVMNAGRVEQLGTPQEVYEAPRSEFVGALPGRQQHPARQGAGRDAAWRLPARPSIAAAARWCRARMSPCPSASTTSRISADQPATGAGNAVEGTVVRNVFLGATRDYVVEARDGTQLRVTARAAGRSRAGQRGVADAAGRPLPRAGGVNGAQAVPAHPRSRGTSTPPPP